jgi:2-polyprenyl-3-methyl-5-hydroxy-6-metoxy-1,4-benzoquinol methylase
VQLPAGARVLDLGAGAALVTRAVAARGRTDLRWIGLDGSLDCIGALRRYTHAAAIVDLERLAELPAGIDAVVAGDVLEHLGQPELLMQRIARALRPGGVLMVSVPNVANVVVRTELLFGRFEYRDRGILDRTHRIFFTRRRLRSMLTAAGLEIRDESASTIPVHLVTPSVPRWFLALEGGLLRLATALLPRLFGYQLLAVARRPERSR